MGELASVGDFCPNAECEEYGKVEAKVIIRYGKTREGRQRLQCKRCKQTFNERKGTLFYNRKTDEKDILECLALLAEGTRISSVSRAKGIKEDTILLNDYRIKRVQIDGLWTYVGHKKGATSER